MSGASPMLNNVVVTGNVVTATLGWTHGGGVYVGNGGQITLTGCEITYNAGEGSASCGGGGLALDGLNAGAVLEASQIMSNSYSGSGYLYGGGMWLDNGAKVTFEGTGNLIAYNEAYAGGGVYMYGNTNLQGVLILDNHGSQSGGGIRFGSGWSGGRIANNYILGNEAGNQGASIYTADCDMEIANNTIVGDFSGPAGIHIYASGARGLKLTNNIVVSHTIGIQAEEGASVTLSHNDVWDNTTNYYGDLSPGSGEQGPSGA